MSLQRRRALWLLLMGGVVIVEVPDAAFNFVPFNILRSGSGVVIDPSFNLRTYANISVTKTYYLNTVTGNDGNSGLTSLLPKKTWNDIIGTGDYDRIIIQNGSYLIRSESSLMPARNLEVIGEGTVYFTSDRSDGLGAWSLTPAQTFTFQATTGGEFIARVFDEGTLTAQGNPTRYIGKSSIAEVEATAGTYWWSAGTLYVHTLDGLTPSGRTDLKYYDSNAAQWSKDSLTWYIENVQFRGGTSLSNASATGGLKVYMKDCSGHALVVAGVDEFITQNGHYFTTAADVANYDVLNTLVTKAIEIDCDFEDGGESSTNQASTAHNACVLVRINGHYHHVTGQCVAEAQTTTRTWMLGCEMNNSSVAQLGYHTQGVAWLDSCTIHDVTTDLQIDVGATIYKHNLTSGGVFVNNGTLTDY